VLDGSGDVLMFSQVGYDDATRRHDDNSRAATIKTMQRKIFWGVLTVLSLITDILLPLWWSIAAFIPIVALSWWVAYRSDWF
jgi:hypothetical protein